MAKKSRKRVARYQRDQSGCMWGLISIFDFRNGRSQKLLPDKKRGSKRLDAAAYANITLESLTDACEVCNDVNGSVRSETSSRDMSKLSVKELMDEEMLGEEDQKKEESVTNGEAKPNTKVDGGYIKKNRRWMRNKMSLDLDSSGFVAAHDLVTERPRHRKHKSCSSVDLNVIVEELCNRIHQKDTDCERHEQDSESVIQSIEEDPSVIEKKLWDSTKVLVNHFTNANGSTKDGKIQPSKELTDALQILNSNKDLFLKLLQDPSSQLVRQIQSSQDIQVEEGKFKVLTGSDMLEHDMGNGKQHNFFWRRFKGLEKNSSRKTGTAEDIDRIVVLKPGSQSSGLSDTNTPCSSLPGSPRIKGDKDHNERAFSLFSFSEFKRKLKHAMRKEQHGMSHQPSDGQPYLANRDKKIGAETIPASPSRDHFFIERIPKTSGGVKVDKAGKLRDDSALTPEQRVSNIYIEAKKHLADIVGNSDIHEDNSGKRRPRSLGRILAYSGYSSPICSPRTEGDMKLSPKGESQTNDEKKTSQDIQASNVGDASQVEQESESEPCIATDLLIHEAEVPNSDPCILDGLPHDSDIDKSIHEAEFPAFEVLADSGRSSDAESQKEGDWTNNSFEQSSPEAIKKSEQDTCEENEQSTPSSESTLVCKVTENTEDLDTVSDATSKPSPISVLEPLFQEDDISPSGIKHSNVEPIQVIQPRQIQFGEEISTPLTKVPSNRICIDDEKYTIEFVKDVVKLSGLTWDELLRRSFMADHLIEPSLLDEIDFLPDLLSCDFNALFDLISEVLREICWLNFGCMLSLAMPYVQPESKGKYVFAEIWKEVDWYLKLEGPPRTLDQIIAKDLAKSRNWMDLQLDCQDLGIHMQEVILEELMEDTILSCICERLEDDVSDFDPPITETKEGDVNIEV